MPKTSNILNTVDIEGFPFFLSISLTVAKPTPAISARSNCDISRVFLRLFNTSLSSISPINHTFDVKIYIILRNCKKKYNILDFFRNRLKVEGSGRYVSNLLKGNANMTLETIARIETALDIDIIGSALSCFVNGYVTREKTSRPHYLNDGD